MVDTTGCAAGSTVRTSSGIYFDLENPSASDVRLKDIAYSLAKTCRYVGQIGHDRHSYSVAEHSVLCVMYAYRELKVQDMEVLRSVFLHDAAEAYVGDISRPLKNLIRAHSDVLEATEKRIDAVIAKRFRCDFERDHAVIKQADVFMMFTEKRHFFGDDSPWIGEHEFQPLPGYEPECLTAQESADLYLSVATELQV